MSIARHTAYNVIGGLLPVVVSLVTVPFYLKIIGLDRYGVLSLFWLLVGYFSFFDFGIGRATEQHIATLHSREANVRSRAFWTGFSLSGTLAVLAVVVAVPLGGLALDALKVGSPTLRAETQAALPLLVAAVPFAILQSVFKGALEGRRHFFIVNLIVSGGAVATGVLPLMAAAIWGPAIPLLIAVSLGVRGAVILSMAIAAARAVPIHGYEGPDRQGVRRMVKFGAWLTVSNIIGPLMVFLDRFLIGAIVSASAVALYVIPFNLISQLLVLPSSLGSALFPRLAAPQRSSSLNRDALFATTFVLTPLAMAAMLIVGPFLRLWLGEAVAMHSTPIALVLIIGFWANGLAQLPYASLQAAARTDLTAKVHLGEILPYFLFLWLGLSYFGAVGAAIAWSVRAMADFIILTVLDRVGLKVLRPALLQGAAVVALSLTMLKTNVLQTDGGSIAGWTLAGVICLGTAIYLLLAVPETVVERLRSWATQIPFGKSLSR